MPARLVRIKAIIEGALSVHPYKRQTSSSLARFQRALKKALKGSDGANQLRVADNTKTTLFLSRAEITVKNKILTSNKNKKKKRSGICTSNTFFLATIF